MKATQELHDLGQSLWLDNITRGLLDNGTLQRYEDSSAISMSFPSPD
jgi:transaldolase